MNFVFTSLISFVVTLLVVPVLIPIARKLGCMDMPGLRRFHKHPTPRWGGVSFFLGVAATLFFWDLDRGTAAYLTAASLLIIIGMRDDIRGLGWKVKFTGMLAAATILIFGGNVVVGHIGRYGDFGKVDLGGGSVVFTYVAVVGVTNAINLIDGLNGLAGGISLIAFLIMGLAASAAGNAQVAIICFAFVGALAGFLRYNFPKANIFMGDSGSLFLGFSLAVVSILLTQNDTHRVSPMLPVLVLLIPIFDAVRVMFARIFKGRNPFKADKTHLHHLIVRHRYSCITSVIFLWLFTAFCGVLALSLVKYTSVQYAIVTLFLSLLLSFFTASLATRR